MEELIKPSFFSGVSERVRSQLAQGYAGWCRFFFEADAVDALRVFRFGLGLLLFFAYLVRAIDNEFYYGANGVLDVEKMTEFFPMKYRWSFLIWYPGNGMLWGTTVAFLVSLLTLSFGFFPRISAGVAYLLHVSFMHRNMGIVYGLDMIATFFLFYLSFAKTDSSPTRKDAWSTMITSMVLRLAQIQVCVIYAYSGWEKLKGMSWWKGEAIWTVFANAQIIRWQMNWVAHFPLVITLATYMTLLWEIYFPALIWNKKLRPWILLGGVALHFGIGLVVFIPYFSMLMILTYVCFLTPEEARRISRRIKSLIPFVRMT